MPPVIRQAIAQATLDGHAKSGFSKKTSRLRSVESAKRNARFIFTPVVVFSVFAFSDGGGESQIIQPRCTMPNFFAAHCLWRAEQARTDICSFNHVEVLQ